MSFFLKQPQHGWLVNEIKVPCFIGHIRKKLLCNLISTAHTSSVTHTKITLKVIYCNRPLKRWHCEINIITMNNCIIFSDSSYSCFLLIHACQCCSWLEWLVLGDWKQFTWFAENSFNIFQAKGKNALWLFLASKLRDRFAKYLVTGLAGLCQGHCNLKNTPPDSLGFQLHWSDQSCLLIQRGEKRDSQSRNAGTAVNYPAPSPVCLRGLTAALSCGWWRARAAQPEGQIQLLVTALQISLSSTSNALHFTQGTGENTTGQ